MGQPKDNLVYGFFEEFRFLSNFYPVPHGVFYSGVDYPTSEHAYQAGKTLDKKMRELVYKATTPGDAKRIGKSFKLRDDWDDIKLLHMEGCVRAKFRNDTVLAQKLLDTGTATLVEANNWGDTFWGKCKGKGKNHLGIILMDIRDDLRNNYPSVVRSVT